MKTPDKIPKTLEEAAEWERARDKRTPSLDERIADPFAPHLLAGSDEQYRKDRKGYNDFFFGAIPEEVIEGEDL